MYKRGSDEERLEALFRAYRAACPDPEASANFMPQLWQRIEGRRTFSFFVRRMASGFVTAAVAATLLMAVYLYTLKRLRILITRRATWRRWLRAAPPRRPTSWKPSTTSRPNRQASCEQPIQSLRSRVPAGGIPQRRGGGGLCLPPVHGKDRAIVGSSSATAASPEEYRARAVATLTSRLKLTGEQVTSLQQIMDETRQRYHELRDRMREQQRPELKAIETEHYQRILAVLTEPQRAEYDKMRAERGEKRRQAEKKGKQQ